MYQCFHVNVVHDYVISCSCVIHKAPYGFVLRIDSLKHLEYYRDEVHYTSELNIIFSSMILVNNVHPSDML